MKIRYTLMIKMIIGFMAGVLIAELLHLSYTFTAGVFVVLNLEPTKRQSLTHAAIRFASTVVGLLLAALIFHFAGFYYWSLAILIAIFIPVSFLLKIEKGLPVSLVAISQPFIAQNETMILNAFYIVAIAISLALALNMFMPPVKKEIQKSFAQMDDALNGLIHTIALGGTADFSPLETRLKKAQSQLMLDIENHYFLRTEKRGAYLDMRLDQVQILKQVASVIQKIDDISEKQLVLDYLKLFDHNIGEANYAVSLREKLDNLLNYFRTQDLPSDRDEFENRAYLYFVLQEMGRFLDVKMEYHRQFTNQLQSIKNPHREENV